MTQPTTEFWMFVVGTVAAMLFLSKDVIGLAVTTFFAARHQRKMAENQHKREVELQAQRRLTAIAANDVVSTLMTDPELARVVIRSLRVQLDEHDRLEAAKRQAGAQSLKEESATATAQS